MNIFRKLSFATALACAFALAPAMPMHAADTKDAQTTQVFEQAKSAMRGNAPTR